MIRALLLAFLLIPCIAQAEQVAPLRWGIRAGFGATVLTDRALDIAAPNDAIFTGEVTFSFMPSRKQPALDLELGWLGSGTSETAFQTYTASLNTNSLLLGLRYREPLRRWLNFYGRAGVTLDWSTLKIQEEAASTTLTDVAFTTGLVGAVGTEWIAHIRNAEDRPRLALGAYLELGWIQRLGQAKFNELKPDGASDTEPARIAFTPIDAGSISLSGPFWRVGGLIRF